MKSNSFLLFDLSFVFHNFKRGKLKDTIANYVLNKCWSPRLGSKISPDFLNRIGTQHETGTDFRLKTNRDVGFSF